MNAEQLMTLEAGIRIKGFRGAHPNDISWPQIALEPFDKAVADLQAFQSVQYTSKMTAKGETAGQKRLRRDIYEDFLRPIRDIAEFRKVNDPALFVDSYIERHGDWDAQVEALANAAEKHQDLLVNYLGRPDFVVELRAALAELRASHASRDLLWGSKAGATGGIEAVERALRKRIHALDGTMTPLLQKNPPLLAAWKSACQIRKTRVDPRPGGDATPRND